MKIRLSQFKMNNGSPFTLEFLGARVHRERALAAHRRHPGCKRSHSALLFYRILRRRGGRDPEAIHEPREEFEGRSRRRQLDDLLIIVEALHRGVKLVIYGVAGAVHPFGASKT